MPVDRGSITFGQIAIKVYRRGGAEWVRAGAGGVSTFANRKSWGGIWWRLPGGTAHTDLLIVYNDHGDDWVWEPARNMEFDRYLALLAMLNHEFRRV